MNIEKDDRSDDIFKTSDADVQLNIYPALERRRVLHVIVPKAVARVVEEELLSLAKKHGKIKLYAEEQSPPKPAGQN